jgi:hypothetical protein
VNKQNKNIRDLYKGITEFNEGYQPRSNLVKDEIGDLLSDSRNVLIGGRKTSVSYWSYMERVVLGEHKFIQHSHMWQSLAPLR